MPNCFFRVQKMRRYLVCSITKSLGVNETISTIVISQRGLEIGAIKSHYRPGGIQGDGQDQSQPSRETDKLKELEFVLSSVFKPKCNQVKKTYKNHQNPFMLFGIFPEFFQFWLENSGPNLLGKLKRTILLLLTPKASLEKE